METIEYLVKMGNKLCSIYDRYDYDHCVEQLCVEQLAKYNQGKTCKNEVLKANRN